MKRHWLLAVGLISLAFASTANSQVAAPTRPHDAQVAIELQVVSVPDSTWEKVVDLDWIASHKSGSFADNRLAFLDRAQRKRLLDALRKDPNTSVPLTPKLMMFSGQVAAIATTEELFFVTGVTNEKQGDQLVSVPKNEPKEVGFKASVHAVVSADRRYVQIDLKAKRTQLESSDIPLIPVQIPVPQLFDAPNGQGFKRAAPAVVQMYIQQPKFATQSVEQKFNVADGATTVIIAGKETRTLANAKRKRSASNDGENSADAKRVACTVLLLVTPIIAVNSEIEQEMLGETPSPDYLLRPPAYIPPSPDFPLPRELKKLTEAASAQKPIRRISAEVATEAKTLDEKSRPKAGATSDTERIQGVWQLVHSQAGDGLSLGVEGDIYFMIDGRRACFHKADGNVEGGLYLDVAGKSKTFDFATSGWTREGIYILEGDVLMMCYDLKTEAQRPTDFAVDRNSQRVLMVFRRTNYPAQSRRQDGSKTFTGIVEQR
jgi:uncharacterized protein (TIGR03067 family)